MGYNTKEEKTKEEDYERVILGLGETEEIACNPTQIGLLGCGISSDQISSMLINVFQSGSIPVGSVIVPLLAPRQSKPVLVDVQACFRNSNGRNFEPYRVDFKMAADEMYLVAFRGGGWKGNFFELDTKNDVGKNVKGTMIKDSIRLGMNGSYIDSGGIGTNAYDLVFNKETRVNEKVSYRNTLVLNRYETYKHIKFLHFYNPQSSKNYIEVAKSLVYMVQLLAEMPRFKPIQEHVRNQWFKENHLNIQNKIVSGLGKPLRSELRDLQNDWADISFELQTDGASEERANILGIAKKKPKTKTNVASSSS